MKGRTITPALHEGEPIIIYPAVFSKASLEYHILNTDNSVFISFEFLYKFS